MVLGTTGVGQVLRYREQLHQAADRKRLCHVDIYDYKFPDLSEIAYNHLLNHLDAYKVKPQFYVINFDDPMKSQSVQSHQSCLYDGYIGRLRECLHHHAQLEPLVDTKNREIFFVESPIILLAAIIWFLKIYENGNVLHFPARH